MWQLDRVVLRSVGHADARFAPLDIDLTGPSGEPTDTVLWLENGGGKTSLLSLAFSVLRPSANEFLARRSDRALVDYVGSGDVSHVVLVWSRPGGGLLGDRDVLVTGQVLAWDGLISSSDPSRLTRMFYGFRATPDLGPGDLPFLDGGRSRTLVQYCDELRRRFAAVPQAEAHSPSDSQKRWLQWLSDRQLDTEVFATQVKINADEGAIAEAFSFPTGDDFVAWALRNSSDATGLDSLVAAVESMRDAISSRGRLRDEARLCDELAAHLDQLDAAHTLIEETEGLLAAATADAGQLAGAFATAREGLFARSARDRARAEEAAGEATTRKTLARNLLRQSTTARRAAVELLIERTDDELDTARDTERDAGTLRDAWRAVGDVHRRDRLQDEARTVQEQLQELDDSLAPVRRRRDRLREGLAAKAHAVADAHARDQAADDALASDLSRERTRLVERQQEDGSHVERLRAESDRATGALDVLDGQLTSAVAAGLLEAGQDVELAAELAGRAAEESLSRHDAAEGRRQQAQELLDGARGDHLEAERELGRAVTARDGLRERVQEMDAAIERAALDPMLCEVADGDRVDPHAQHELLVGRLAQRAEHQRTLAVAVDVEIAETRRISQAIAAGALAPARVDLEQAVSALREAGIAAWTGWVFLEQSVAPDDHAQLQSSHPDLVDGIVVDGEADVAAAADLLRTRPRWAPVRVATKQDLLAATARDATTLPARRALHDRAAASRLQDALQGELDAADSRRADAHATEERFRAAAARLRSLLDSWPDPAELRRQLQRSQEHADGLQAALDDLADDVERLTTELDAAATAAETAREAATSAARRRDDLQRLAASQAGRAALLRRVDEAEESLRPLLRRLEEASRRVAGIDEQLTGLAVAAQRRTGQLDLLRERCERLGITPSPGDVPDASLHDLDRGILAADAELARQRDDSGLDERARDLQRQLAEVAARLDEPAPDVLALAEELAASARAADASSQRRALVAADAALTAATDHRARTEVELERLQAEHAAITGESRPLDEDADVDRTDPDALADLARALEARSTRERSDADALDASAQQHRDAAAADEQAAARLQELVQDLVEERDDVRLHEGEPAWSGEDPAEEARATKRRITRLTDELNDAVQLRTTQRSNLSAVLSEPRNRRFGEDGASTLPIVLDLTRADAEQLGPVAGRYRDQLHERSRVIAAKLADIDRQRRDLATTLAHHARDALRTLHTLGLRSRMPDGLGEWSGRQFVRVGHPDPPPDPAALVDRMGQVVDDIVEGRLIADGHRLRFHAARAAVSGDGFAVRIVKPHPDLRHDPVDVTELSGFSGGQRLTAAVALFLTMMNLRNHQAGSQHGAAVLLLDNPFGKSSADTFVELQRRLAERLGVQLVYTTAVKDLEALRLFSRVARLAHKRHTGTGRLHVVAEEPSSGVVGIAMDRLRDAASEDGTEVA